MLTAIRRIETLPKIGSIWLCRCECGSETKVRQKNLANGHTKSCGCLTRSNNLRHGMDKTPEYRAWQAINNRCSNPNRPDYKDYGGRGIVVVQSWRRENADGFTNFLTDMGLRPSPKHSIDRIDVNGPYGRGNCRWATAKEQARNKRNNSVFVVGGRQMLQCEIVETFGISAGSLKYWINKGRPIHQILENISHKRGPAKLWT